MRLCFQLLSNRIECDARQSARAGSSPSSEVGLGRYDVSPEAVPRALLEMTVRLAEVAAGKLEATSPAGIERLMPAEALTLPSVCFD